MEISKTSQVLIAANVKGYFVNEKGDVYFNGRKRSLNLDKRGYLSFTVRVKINEESIRTRVMVHRLVAYQKYGDKIFEIGIQVRHLDGNSKNNLSENILIGTAVENCSDKIPSVRLRAAVIATSFVKKHDHEKIIDLHKKGYSYDKIMKELGIKSKGTISFIIRQSMEAKK